MMDNVVGQNLINNYVKIIVLKFIHFSKILFKYYKWDPLKRIQMYRLFLLSLFLVFTTKIWAYDCFECNPVETSKEYATRMRYAQELENKLISVFKIPFDMSNYIAQGLTKQNDDLFISYYYKNKYGENPEQMSSIIVRYNIEERTIKEVWELKQNNSNYTGHVSGLIVLDKKFLIVDGKKFIYFEKDNAQLVQDLGQHKVYSSQSTKVFSPNRGLKAKISVFSFISQSPDHRGLPHAWVGEFLKAEGATQILGYEITDGVVSRNPTYRFDVPPQIFQLQGVALLSPNETQYQFAVSKSYGSHPSKIYRLEYKMSGFRSRLMKKELVFTGPSGLENLHVSNDSVWSLSESAASYFQERSNPWSDYFPFLIEIQKNKLLGLP
jgi:hypothetical protein